MEYIFLLVGAYFVYQQFFATSVNLPDDGESKVEEITNTTSTDLYFYHNTSLGKIQGLKSDFDNDYSKFMEFATQEYNRRVEEKKKAELESKDLAGYYLYEKRPAYPINAYIISAKGRGNSVKTDIAGEYISQLRVCLNYLIDHAVLPVCVNTKVVKVGQEYFVDLEQVLKNAGAMQLFANIGYGQQYSILGAYISVRLEQVGDVYRWVVYNVYFANYKYDSTTWYNRMCRALGLSVGYDESPWRISEMIDDFPFFTAGDVELYEDFEEIIISNNEQSE